MIEQGMSRRSVLKGAVVAAAAAGVSVVAAAGPAHARGPRGAADTVVMNGKVLVMDRRRRRAEAVAIKDGKILAIGSNREITRLTAGGTQVVDAGGGTVLPGINDSHFHFGNSGLAIPPYTYSLAGTESIVAIQDVLRRAVADARAAGKPVETTFVRASGWNESRLNQVGQKLTRAHLDAVSDGYKIIAPEFSYHALIVNSAVLDLPEVKERIATASPELVPYIERDANGELTGVFREGAMSLVSVAPPWTPAEVAGSLDAAIAAVHSLGITSVTDPGVDAAMVAIYADRYRAGKLPLRVNLMLGGGRNPKALRAALDGFSPLRGIDPRWIRVGQVKLFADGVPTAARTAYLHEPYEGTNTRGSLTLDGATIEEQIRNLHTMIRTAIQAGFQVGTHATGDAAIDTVVQGYLAAMGRNSRRAALRNYVIHADLTPEATLRTMAAHGIGANFNATIKYLLGTDLYPVLGKERTDYQWPYRTALDLGVKVASASDAPVTPASWLQGVAGAVTRKSQFGDAVAGAAERISVEESLVTYTRTPAWQDHADGWKGTLQEGFVGDLCVVDGDVLGTAPEALPGLAVSTTIVGGEVVYDRTTSAARDAEPAVALVQGFSSERGKACLEDGMCCCRVSERALT
ncbi:amidohydrolase [Cryptosporangium minutisporangium]|uniref:Amidohydrolase n=1 Tax=Cryptosporangium minutisporangium TaxID=113569 RepID=A0ABP6SRI5_9ACTN